MFKSKKTNEHHSADLVVAGGGASGLFAAWLAANCGMKVVLHEAALQPGRKLAISGGGHANFSNSSMGPEHYLCGDKKFCCDALRAFPPAAFIEYIKYWRLPHEERAGGRLFLKCRAKALVDRLARGCSGCGCRIITNSRLLNIGRRSEYLEAQTTSGTFLAPRIILAFGSPAMPALAGCRDCWNLPRQLGHRVEPPTPALVPFIIRKLPDGREFGSLAGIGLPVDIALRNPDGAEFNFSGDLLFTHEGISGPAVLRVSLRHVAGGILKVDFLPGVEVEKLLDLQENSKKTPRSLLRRHLPPRLVDFLVHEPLASRKIAGISRRDRTMINASIKNFCISDARPAGLEKCEVCAGGVDVREIDSRTMESRLHAGIYLIGEMLDVTGDLGGYNLHWAFASAWCAVRSFLPGLTMPGVHM